MLHDLSSCLNHSFVIRYPAEQVGFLAGKPEHSPDNPDRLTALLILPPNNVF